MLKNEITNKKKVLSLVVLLFTNAQHVMLMMVELHLWDTIWTYASSLYCHTGCFISASVKVGKPFLNKRKQWFIYYPELCAIQNMKTVHKSHIFPQLDLLNLTDCSDLSFVRQWTAQVNSTQAPPQGRKGCDMSHNTDLSEVKGLFIIRGTLIQMVWNSGDELFLLFLNKIFKKKCSALIFYWVLLCLFLYLWC